MRSEKRSAKTAVAVLGFLFQVALSFLMSLWVMLGLGTAHDYWPKVPAFGYWSTWTLVTGVSALAGAIHGGLRIKVKDE